MVIFWVEAQGSLSCWEFLHLNLDGGNMDAMQNPSNCILKICAFYMCMLYLNKKAIQNSQYRLDIDSIYRINGHVT